jgi:hypothetical protein
MLQLVDIACEWDSSRWAITGARELWLLWLRQQHPFGTSSGVGFGSGFSRAWLDWACVDLPILAARVECFSVCCGISTGRHNRCKDKMAAVTVM